MADPVKIAIVGCGGMGRRHLAGIAELAKTDHNNIRLVAVCDLDPAKSSAMADEAAALLGARPTPFNSVEKMAREEEGLEGADCTTDTNAHHRVSVALLGLGLHTMCEKPLALTMRSCDLIIAAAKRSGKILSIAENFRRDPINRLVRALLDDGAIGEPRFVMETLVAGRDEMFITPWRHMKLTGALTLDAGVHNADILQYYFGEPASVYGQTRLFEKIRKKSKTLPAWWDGKAFPDEIEPTGEDAMFGLINFKDGVVGQWVFNYAGHGERFEHRRIFGSKGSIAAPGDRNGRPIRLTLDDGTDIQNERILEHAPNFRLSPVAGALFGGERIWKYDLTFAETDRKIIALEYHEFAECIRHGAPPEVDGVAAKRAMAMVYGLFESQLAGRPVTIAEVEAGGVDAYQNEIDRHIGLANSVFPPPRSQQERRP